MIYGAIMRGNYTSDTSLHTCCLQQNVLHFDSNSRLFCVIEPIADTLVVEILRFYVDTF